jgi:bifunctional DNA-binding transcriptional regulator/antitoxin component of YhaV-PrlF toxin-antitoxin module
MSMAQQSKLTTGGQITVPAHVRKRWKTSQVTVEDRGDHLIVRPMSEDRATRVAALRGMLNFGNRPGAEIVAAAERMREEDRELEARKERERFGARYDDE